MAAWLERLEQEGSLQIVKPGDASMAAPFTVREPTVMPCTAIIRRGLSTLVTTLQMFKILGLMCLTTRGVTAVRCSSYRKGTITAGCDNAAVGRLAHAHVVCLS
eukprot:jgi/Tetstr1/421933/TSEL_012832.t1